MKKLVTILAVALVSVGVFAQSPQKMSYQAIVRNSSNALVTSTTIGMRISILQGSGSGSAVYVETHTPTTNVNGLVSIEVGAGTVVSGTFSTISWANGPFYIKTDTDPTGGTSYSITGTSQLLSVPYALYAEKSGNGDPWLTVGNSLTTVGPNFLGTIDSQPLMFKVNSKKAGYIDWDYNIANTGFGFQTLISNTTGHSNTANGYEALQSNTTGVQNSAIGKLALSANTEGNNNIALGSEALSYNTTGSFNVAAGTSTMRFNTLGNYNTANGIWSLYNNTQGSYNTAYGASALQSNITGNNNTAIGYNANVVSGNLTNATAIGNGAIATANDEVRIGNVKVSSLYFGTANNLAVTTDSVPNMFYDHTTGQIMRSTAAAAGGGTDDWHIVGNVGTIDGQNFIGTTDNVPLNFRVSNNNAGRIDPFLFNTFFGIQTGNANTTGVYNTATGFSALHSNTTGNFNAAFGNHSLTSNTTGIENSAFGSSLVSNTTGYDNSGFGYSSLSQNTTGSGNSAFGAQALSNNITGASNSAFGHLSLQQNTAGGNSAFGYWSLALNTTGSYNAAFGSSSLNHNKTGNYNTAVGAEALLFNTLGNNNASFGTFSLHSNTTGSNNSAFGFQAGINLTTETNLTLIGANAGIYATNGYDNATALGSNAIVAGSNNMILGNNNVNVGIGLSGITSGPQNKLEINTGPSVPNASGLRFRQLTSSSTKTTNPGTGVLSVNTDGDVILVPDATGTGGSSIHFIGESYGGGIVFYIYDGGLHGLIAATTDQSTFSTWDNGVSKWTGTTGDGILAGKTNTALIVATQIGDNISTGGSFAAKYCVDYMEPATQLGDWYLPSISELRWLWGQRSFFTGFTTTGYWSSTETDKANAFMCDWTTGFPNNTAKNANGPGVRAVRSF